MGMVYNPFGQGAIDFDEQTAASRVGARIRRIRTARGLSQGELGAKVGLSADRVQKYENGARKPKRDMLESIAAALGVSPLALSDPNTTSYIGAMYAFFELEEQFNMRIDKSGEDDAPEMRLTVQASEGLYQYMNEWFKVYTAMQADMQTAATQEDKAAILMSYREWEWNYPQAIVDRTSKDRQKQLLKNKIVELQELYDKLQDT